MQGWTMGLAVIGLIARAATVQAEPEQWLTLHVLAIQSGRRPRPYPETGRERRNADIFSDGDQIAMD